VSGTHRSLHFARDLHEAGYGVRVITVSESRIKSIDRSLSDVFPYPESITRVDHGSTIGSLYLSAKRSDSAQQAATEPSGQVDPAQRAENNRRGFLTRPLAFLKRQVAAWDVLPDERRGWYKPAVKAGLELGNTERIDAVFASGPPWTAVMVARKLARELKCHLIADFRDPWTGNTGRQTPYDAEWCHWIAKRWEQRTLREARLVLFNSPSIMEAAGRSSGAVNASKLRSIPNGSDMRRREFESPIAAEGQLRIRHFGNLYRGRSVQPLVSALQALIRDGSLEPGEVCVELIGRIAAEVQELVASPPDGVEFRAVPTLPYTEAAELMMEPAVLLVVQPSNLNVQIPTKLYDYLCTGNPALVMAAEDSATWAAARSFGRCARLHPAESTSNEDVLRKLVDSWRSGNLKQERTVEDTEALSKKAVGEMFLGAVAPILRNQTGDSRDR
jgi:hypothetical protein